MQVALQPANLGTAFDRLTHTLEGFEYTHQRGRMVERPKLGQDMNGIVLETADRLGSLVSARERKLLQAWAGDWSEAGGEVEGVIGASTRGIITGPDVSVGSGLYAPAVRYDVRRHKNSPYPRELSVTLGFVDAVTHFRDTADRLSFTVPDVDLQLLRHGLPEALHPTQVALAALSVRANRVFAAVQDPLKPALHDVLKELTADPERAAQLKWLRPPSSGPAESIVEVCFVPVDPDLYGEGRYAAYIRDGAQPDSPVLAYTDDEWDAFVLGAKDGEFDI